MNARIRTALLALLLASCAGMNRYCSACTAQNFGADWLVVQHKMDGTVFRCWRLNNKSIANEENSDGIYWTSNDGHLVHISGWYNRVQVIGGGFDSAAKQLGIDLAACQ